MTSVLNPCALKLSEVMAECGYVQKGSKNEFHGYRYASAEDVFTKIRPALAARGIAINTSASLERLSDDFKNAVVKLTLSFTDAESGTFVNAVGIGQGSDKGDKAVMKADTAALKYALASAFLISWGDDPEADVTTDKASAKSEPEATEAPKKRVSAKRAKAEGPVPPNELAELIQTAGSIDSLTELRKSVLLYNGTEDYEPLVNAFKARKTELNNAAGTSYEGTN